MEEILINELREIPEENHHLLEIESRLNFDPKYKETAYYNLIKRLPQDYEAIEIKSETWNINKDRKVKIRKRTINGKTEITKKTLIKEYFNDIKVPNLFKLKYVIAKEEKINIYHTNRDSEIYIRNISRRRYICELYSNIFYIDLSKVNNGKGEIEYEIEVEVAESDGGYTEDLIGDFVEVTERILAWCIGSEILYGLGYKEDFSIYINSELMKEDKNIGKDNYGNKLKNIDRGIIPNPVPLTKAELNYEYLIGDNPPNYTVSLKADGERRLLIFSKYGVSLILPPFHYNFISNNKFKSITIFDVELIKSEHGNYTVIPFDLIMFENEDLRSRTYQERIYGKKYISNGIELFDGDITLEKAILEYGNTDSITMEAKDIKFFSTSNEMFIKIRTLLDKKVNFETDGLIFTPNDKQYTTKKIMKWKPREKITIDLLYLNQRLYAGGKKKSNIKFDGMISGYKFPNVTITDKVNKFNIEGEIIEFEPIFDREENVTRFESIKIRKNKSRPNTFETASSNWRIINDFVSKATIRGSDYDLIKIYHRKIKDKLYTDTKNITYILDLGSGKGADTRRWKNTNAKFIIAVEIDSFSLNKLEKLSKVKGFDVINSEDYLKNGHIGTNKPTIITINKSAEEWKYISKVVNKVTNDNGVDLISVMDSGTFFFENKDMLNDVKKTIQMSSKKGTKIIYKMLDGRKVINWFKDSGTTKISIDYEKEDSYKLEVDKNDLRTYGKAKLFIGGWINDQIEYITNPPLLFDFEQGLQSKVIYNKIANQDKLVNGIDKLKTVSSFYVYGMYEMSDGSDNLTDLKFGQKREIVIQNNKYTRVGTDKDFFSSFLFNAFPDFELLNENKRLELVIALRNNISDWLWKDDNWLKFSGGMFITETLRYTKKISENEKNMKDFTIMGLTSLLYGNSEVYEEIYYILSFLTEYKICILTEDGIELYIGKKEYEKTVCVYHNGDIYESLEYNYLDPNIKDIFEEIEPDLAEIEEFVLEEFNNLNLNNEYLFWNFMFRSYIVYGDNHKSVFDTYFNPLMNILFKLDKELKYKPVGAIIGMTKEILELTKSKGRKELIISANLDFLYGCTREDTKSYKRELEKSK